MGIYNGHPERDSAASFAQRLSAHVTCLLPCALLQVLCGPHMLAVLSPDANDQMWLAQDVCLAIIALAAGSQLRWAEFVENMHTVLCLCAGVFICTWCVPNPQVP